MERCDGRLGIFRVPRCRVSKETSRSQFEFSGFSQPPDRANHPAQPAQ